MNAQNAQAKVAGFSKSGEEVAFMRLALRLAKKAFGRTSPNPMVGAVLVRNGRIIGQGWHHGAGLPHAEIEALKDAQARGNDAHGATIYVTLEPCCTHGRTPPCTEALIAAGVGTVVVAATDPNPAHSGRGFAVLKKAGIQVSHGLLAQEATHLNKAFNHWIVRGTPLVTVKAAMTLDGKIATATGDSKWITGERSRAHAMQMRLGSDAILAGIGTILADDPGLTLRLGQTANSGIKPLRRIILDSRARTPLQARVVSDAQRELTTVVVTKLAPRRRLSALQKQVKVWEAPICEGHVDLTWVVKKLGSENVTSLLVEGGGEVNAAFLEQGLVQRVAFFYAPKIIGGRDAKAGVGGLGVGSLSEAIMLEEPRWRKLGPDLLLEARVVETQDRPK
jgi:diaminohydroxyphosphoribosylaminopyrimidine deaminase / 5-amino-6-(5-phosphoribosylamino)uracil reductase